MNHSKPLLDASQDWYLLLGQEDDTSTILKFVRQIDTCDSSGDIIIQVSINCKCTTMYSRDNLLNESIFIVIYSRHFMQCTMTRVGWGEEFFELDSSGPTRIINSL